MALLGIDIGTSGTKTLLIDDEGGVLAAANAEYPLSTPRPGWAEQSPDDWWEAAARTVREVLSRSNVPPGQVRGIGLSGQMHGSVFLDAAGDVLRPALLWCDQRTAEQCEWINREVGADRIAALTSNPVLTGFQAPKIIWLRQREPEVYARVRRVLLPKDFVRFKLTGEFHTEVSDASGTALFNVRERCWAGEILEALDIPAAWLPECHESTVVSARLSAEGSRATGLPAGTPVVGGGGDQAAGAVGSGIVAAGLVSSSLGTSGVVFAFSASPQVDPELRVHTFCHAVPGCWHVMGVVLSAGGSLRWYRDTIAGAEVAEAKARGIDPYECITAAAAQAPPGSEGLLFLPYLTGERTPYPDPYARGVYFGLSLAHDRRHLARAVLEGVAYGLRDSFEILAAMGVPVEVVRASGGGARSGLWRQIMADVTGYEHVTINVDEGPAFGVALLAGVGTGVWSTVEEACATTIQVEGRTSPVTATRATYDRYHGIYRSLYPALREGFRELHDAAEPG